MTQKRWLIAGLVVIANLFLAMYTLAQSDPLPLPQTSGEYILVEGDIMLPADVVQGRATYQATLWTSRTVPYVFHSSVDITNQNRMLAAMEEWESVSGVTFVPRASQTNYIEIINSGAAGQSAGNWSYVGMIGGRQYLSIYNWTYKYIIMHELAHALGYWHEQSRPDRDSYVTIQWANIPDDVEHNFAIRGTASTVGTYDFASIMHYDQYAFSSNGQRTIVVKPGYEAYQNVIGNRSYLSESDKAGMALLYPEVLPPLAGDTPVNAIVIDSTNYNYTDAVFQFTEGDEPFPTACVGSTPVTDTVWFKIPASALPRVAYLASSGYDSILALYSDISASLVFEGCSDSYGSSGTEILDVPLQPYTDYYVQVGAWDGLAGTLIFTAYLDQNLITNGSFDWGTTPWVVKSVPSTRVDDKLKVNYTGMSYSWGGMVFKGGTGENSTIKQTRTAAATGVFLNAGNTYLYGGYVNSKAVKSNVIIKLVAKYADGTNTQSKVFATGSTNSIWTFYSGTLTLARTDTTQIIMTVNNKSLGGSTKLDNLMVVPYDVVRSPLRGQRPAPDKHAPSVSTQGLPTLPSHFRGNN